LTQQDIARAYIQIGKVQGGPGAANLGDREGAVKSFRTARDLLASPAARPDAPVTLVSDYIEATRRLAETLLSLPGRRTEARAIAEDAVGAAEALGRRQPADAAVQGLLAAAFFTVALTIDGAQALPYWSKAGAIYERMLAARPGDPDAQRNVALVEKYLASTYFDAGDNSRALEHHQRAQALDEKRLAVDPANRQTQLDVAFDLGNVAHVLTRQRRLRDGAEYYERSLAIRKALADSDPGDALAASRVAFARGQLASIYHDLGRLGLAHEHAQAAVAIFEAAPSRDVAVRRNLSSALRTLGRIDAARGRPGAACTAWGRAYDILRTLEPRERAEGVEYKIDPLDELGPRVAACRARMGRD
jgi:tetratricopeptide (TPR) repeat protein